MATDAVNLPQGFVLDEQPEQQEGKQGLPSGFVLDSQADGQSLDIQQSQAKAGRLIPMMKGSLPGALPDEQLGFGIAHKQEMDRRFAYNELKKIGMNDRQIELAAKTQSVIDRPPIGRTIGAIAGTLAAGRLVPGPVDDAAIATTLLGKAAPVVGAGIGGVAGDVAQTGIEERRIIGKREALEAFATEAAFEVGGRVATKAGKFVLSPITKKIAPAAASLVEDFGKVGGTFSPTELDRRFSLQIAEGIARGSFGSKQIFQEFEEKQGRAALAYADNIIDAIGEGISRQTPEQIGEVFAEGITKPNGRVLSILDDLVDPLYKQVDEISKKATVPTSSLKRTARKHLETDARLNGQFLSGQGRAKLNKIAGMSDVLSFSDARTLRSSYLKDVRKLARDADQSESIVREMAKTVDDAIFSPGSASGIDESGLNLLRNTNALYKAGKEGIEATFPERLAKRLLRNPSNVAKEAFPAGNPKAIRALRESLTTPVSGRLDPEGRVIWNQLRQTWLADAVEQATKEGVVKPKVFDNIVRKMGPDAVSEMFPEGNIAEIRNLFDLVGRKPPSGNSLFVRGGQAAGLGMMYKGARDGDYATFTAGSALALGPITFAKLATNPKGVKLLTAGLKIKPGSSALIPNTARIVNLLREMDKEEVKAAREKRTQAERIKQQRKLIREGPEGFGFSGL